MRTIVRGRPRLYALDECRDRARRDREREFRGVGGAPTHEIHVATVADTLTRLDSPALPAPLFGCASPLRRLPDRLVVHADPPWTYRGQVSRGRGEARDAYDLMSLGAIVRDLAGAAALASHAYLALWVTGPLLAEVIAAVPEGSPWSFLGCGAWVKEGPIGIGHHWRGQVELLTLWRVGRPEVHGVARSGHAAPRRRHSEKPELWLRELLSAWAPAGSGVAVLDLYAGLAPAGRAALAVGAPYLGIEVDPKRAGLACAASRGRITFVRS